MAIFRNNEYKNLILIFLIALSLRMLLFIAVGPWDEQVANERILTFDDAPGYHSAAIRIVENKPINAIYDRALYQYFIALLYSIFGYKPYTIIIFQIIMGSLTCIFLYKIGRKIFHEKTALFAGLFLAFESSNILYSNHLLSETMYTFLFIIHIYFLVKFLMEKNIRVLVYSAIFLGLSTHVRPISLYFPIFIIWPLFLYFRSNLRKGILSFLILMSVFSLTVTPWMLRNYIVAGKFVHSRAEGRAQYWFFPNIMNIINPPHTFNNSPLKKELCLPQTGKYRGYFGTEIQAQEIPTIKKITKAILADTERSIEGMYRYFSMLNSGAYPKILGLPAHRMTREIWDKGLWEMAKVAIQEKSKFALFFMFLSITVLSYLYSTMCFGIYAAIRKKEFIKIVLFVSIIVYFAIASSGPIASAAINPRLRVPIIPYVIILSCYGMTELIPRFRKSTTGYVQTSDSTS